MKRKCSKIMAVLMVLTLLLPLGAFAAETEDATTDDGYLSDFLVWYIEDPCNRPRVRPPEADVVIIRSVDELLQICGVHGEMCIAGFRGLCWLFPAPVDYAETFFETQYLAIVTVMTGGYVNFHYVENIRENGDIIIRRVRSGFTFTIRDFSIIIELCRNFQPEQFSVEFIEGEFSRGNGIHVSPHQILFPNAVVGYAERTPQEVRAFTGIEQPTGELTVTLTGPNADSFVLSETTLPSIEPGTSASFTVAPITGLATGRHVATVTVSGENGIFDSLNLRFVVIEPAPTPFEDIADHWADTAIRFVYGESIMDGVTDTTFAPDATISRAMAATILYRTAGSPIVRVAPAFDDVPAGEWFSDAVAWAHHRRIVRGVGNGLFAPHDNVTREQFVTMLYRYADWTRNDSRFFNLDFRLDFPYVSQLSYWANRAMRWANYREIITGTDDGTLNPQGFVTRAEAAAMITRLLLGR